MVGALSIKVVGADFPNKRGPTRRFEIALCAPGEKIELRPEPKNRADENAVAIYSVRGVQLGYVPSERAAWLIRQLSEGREARAVFQEATEWGAVIRVAFDGADPVVPPPTLKRPKRDDAAFIDPDSDFYPDFLPDD